MTTNQQEAKLLILTTDYSAARDDERTLTAVEATFFGLALTALSIIGFSLIGDCRLVTTSTCYYTPDYVLAAAPLVPLAIIAYLQIIGSNATIRSFYLRILEREIRLTVGTGGRNFASYPGLPLLSATDLSVAHGSLREGARGPRILTNLIFFSVLVVFGGVAVASILIVDWPWKLAMFGLYFLGGTLIAQETAQSTVGGRRLFKTTIRNAVARKNESLEPAESDGKHRSLVSYLILPRPADLIKAPFFPAMYLVGALTLPNSGYALSSEGILRGIVLWTCLEFLIYQARYQLNDIRGIDDDRRHPLSRARGRLPLGDLSDAAVANAVRTSLRVMFLRLYVVAIIATIPSLGVWKPLIAYTVLVFGVALLYETIRSRKPQSARSRRAVSWTIYLVVGLGYGVRGMAGYLAVQADFAFPSAGTWIPVAIFLLLYGTMFVVHTWTLEACSYCLSPVHSKRVVHPSAIGVEWITGLKDKPHIFNLLSEILVRTRGDGVEATDGRTDTLGSYSRALSTRARWRSAVNASTLAGSTAAGVAGLCLITHPPAFPQFTWLELAPIACLLGGIALCLGRSWLRWSSVIVSGIAILVLGHLSGMGWPLSLVATLPWLSFSVTCSFFRAASFRELAYGMASAIAVARLRTKLYSGHILGNGASRALGLNSLRELANLQYLRRKDKRILERVQADRIE